MSRSDEETSEYIAEEVLNFIDDGNYTEEELIRGLFTTVQAIINNASYSGRYTLLDLSERLAGELEV